jgi:hypothetical protein
MEQRSAVQNIKDYDTGQTRHRSTKYQKTSRLSPGFQLKNHSESHLTRPTSLDMSPGFRPPVPNRILENVPSFAGLVRMAPLPRF